jgi:hypothetical protein
MYVYIEQAAGLALACDFFFLGGIYVCLYWCMRVCKQTYADMQHNTRAYIHTYTDTHMHTQFMHHSIYMYVYICIYMYVCLQWHMRVYVCTCVCM